MLTLVGAAYWNFAGINMESAGTPMPPNLHKETREAPTRDLGGTPTGNPTRPMQEPLPNPFINSCGWADEVLGKNKFEPVRNSERVGVEGGCSKLLPSSLRLLCSMSPVMSISSCAPPWQNKAAPPSQLGCGGVSEVAWGGGCGGVGWGGVGWDEEGWVGVG
jgi:hypothetical protein